MKKVFQTIVDKEKGNCMQAAVASLLEKELKEVVNFIEQENFAQSYMDFLKDNGYEIKWTLFNRNWNILETQFKGYCKNGMKMADEYELTLDNLKKYIGVDGVFMATVLSPFLATLKDLSYHAVLVDKDLNIIHDPNKLYANIKHYPLDSLLGCNGVCHVEIIEKI